MPDAIIKCSIISVNRFRRFSHWRRQQHTSTKWCNRALYDADRDEHRSNVNKKLNFMLIHQKSAEKKQHNNNVLASPISHIGLVEWNVEFSISVCNLFHNFFS